MMNARLMNILRAPIVTEKSARAEQTNTYVFKVVKDATKQEIKQAVETIFSVDVGAVRTRQEASFCSRLRLSFRLEEGLCNLS